MEHPADPDAARVMAAPRHLRHLDDPERHLAHATPAVPRTRSGWVRAVLHAPQAAGARAVLPQTAEFEQLAAHPQSGARADGRRYRRHGPRGLRPEGQVKHLKLVERSTHGRAGFALRRRRVLAA